MTIEYDSLVLRQDCWLVWQMQKNVIYLPVILKVTKKHEGVKDALDQ